MTTKTEAYFPTPSGEEDDYYQDEPVVLAVEQGKFGKTSHRSLLDEQEDEYPEGDVRRPPSPPSTKGFLRWCPRPRNFAHLFIISLFRIQPL